MTFFQRLQARSAEIGSRLCVGLDPRAADAGEAKQIALALIEATAPYAAAFKPNAAFYEQHGPAGVEALIEVVAAVPEEIPVILDAKRGDIASTAEAYARACIEVIGAGAVTVNSYLGSDAIDPFLAYPDSGVFVLCRTSNPSAGAIQDQWLGDETVAERVARLAAGWAGSDRLGLVVGATVPDELARIRAAAPEHWILCPGVGAQGADPGGLAAGLREDGGGLLVPVSRAVSDAADPAAAAEALAAQFAGLTPGADTTHAADLAHDLHAAGCVRFGEFTLRSGIVSPVYVDLRRLVGFPATMRRVAEAYRRVLTTVAGDRLGAVPYGALPIATAVSLVTDTPMVWPRPAKKGHGTGALVEGDWAEGDAVVLIDDVITSGTSAIEAAEMLRASGLVVTDLVVLLDRSDDASGRLEAAGIRMHAVSTLRAVVDSLGGSGAIDGDQHRTVTAFLGGP